MSLPSFRRPWWPQQAGAFAEDVRKFVDEIRERREALEKMEREAQEVFRRTKPIVEHAEKYYHWLSAAVARREEMPIDHPPEFMEAAIEYREAAKKILEAESILPELRELETRIEKKLPARGNDGPAATWITVRTFLAERKEALAAERVRLEKEVADSTKVLEGKTRWEEEEILCILRSVRGQMRRDVPVVVPEPVEPPEFLRAENRKRRASHRIWGIEFATDELDRISHRFEEREMTE